MLIGETDLLHLYNMISTLYMVYEIILGRNGVNGEVFLCMRDQLFVCFNGFV